MKEGQAASGGARFTLFIAADSSHSLVALANLEQAIARLQQPAGLVEIVNVFERPDLAQEMRVLVTPTLLSRQNPKIRVIGDLSSVAHLEAFLK